LPTSADDWGSAEPLAVANLPWKMPTHNRKAVVNQIELIVTRYARDASRHFWKGARCSQSPFSAILAIRP
jgi:hypothetical protein